MIRLFSVTLLVSSLLTAPALAQDYQLVWEDQFLGVQLDPTKWQPQIGTGCPSLCGWGNNELQYYRAENATVAGGFLTITAREESFGGRNYTSARLRTKNLGDWTYGRFEMRAKMPIGQGLWPAFWMLPTDEVYGTWAASGEIDIMEYLGQNPSDAFGTLHYGGQFPANTFTSNGYTLPSGTFNDDFHVFTLEWEPCEMRWYVDGLLYATQTSWNSSGGPYPAPFDERFHFLLNVAVGGNLPGPPDQTTMFPQEMVVDWVRVYQKTSFSACIEEFDGMDHGNPQANGWFAFGGGVGGGGINGNLTDLPPVDGCRASLEAGYGSGGTPGFFGGFGLGNPKDLTGFTHFSFWINPDPGQDYTLEINLQDDDDGDNAIPGSPNGADDEFQYNFVVSPTGPGAISGGGWQRVSIPLTSFFDDNSFHFGGNGVFDPVPTGSGGNGQLINVVWTVVSNSGSDATFRTDRWAFTSETSSLTGRVWNDTDGDGVKDGGETGLNGVTVDLIDVPLSSVVSTQATAGDGDYSFSGLVGGVYEVQVNPATLPPGAFPTYDPDGTGTAHEFAMELDCDLASPDRDFGYAPTASTHDARGLVEGLYQNAPNPFTPRTAIEFALAEAGYADLAVFDMAGRRVRSLVSTRLAAGTHRVEWDGLDDGGRVAPAGVYYYALQTERGRWVKRMARLK